MTEQAGRSSESKESRESRSNNFVFRDVEESLDKFSGETGKTFAVWIKDFEDVSAVCEWNDIQKYLYARRLLSGAAKLAVDSATNITSWAKLKNYLKEEFDSTPDCLDIHRALEGRKKSVSETFLEYIYAMKQIASRGQVDEKSLVSYIVAGIQDDVVNKTVLYEAKDIRTLKEKIKIYQTIKNQQVTKKSTKPSDNSGKGRSVPKKRCFNCGSPSHLTAACPNKAKGARCFNCGDYGHMSRSCPKPKKNEVAETSEKVNLVSAFDMTVSVIVNGKNFTALVDTGSDVSLMRRSAYALVKKDAADYDGPSIPLAGFGASLKDTLGSFSTTLTINDYPYSSRLHVVPNVWLPRDVLIGKDILKHTKIVIERGKATLFKVDEESATKSPSEDIGVVSLTEEENPLENIDVVELIKEDEPESIRQLKGSRFYEEIRDLVQTYHPIKPQRSCIEMKILLDSETPIYQKPRRLAPREKEAVRDQIKQWLADGVIRESDSDFASPVVLARKKDGSYRLCIDYRKLNSKVVKDRFPLPNMEDIIQSLYHAKVFTTLDLRNGFFHVDIEEKSCKYTSFVTPDGQYEFLKAPFGLCNSPAVFQRFINAVFHDLILKGIVLVYLDDVIIPAEDERDCIEKLKVVLKIAERNGLIVKWEKCKFVQRRVEFLGHVIEAGSIKPSPEKTKAVSGFPTPKNLKQVRSFLGLTGFFRKFIPSYSLIAKPLTDLTQRNIPFKFERNQQDAFNTLKDILCKAPVLKLFNPAFETQLHTDASKEGYGAVLLQRHCDDNQLHPVVYLSFKTTKCERNYSSYELEVLAIVKSLRKLRTYLLGLRFDIYTDCKAFQLTMRRKELSSRIARWALLLEEFDCSVHHRSGATMKHVDALSRYPSVLPIEDGLLSRIRNAQLEDEYCRLLTTILGSKQYEDFLMRGGVIYKLLKGKYLLVVPKQLQREVLRRIHEEGHVNSKKVATIAGQEYYIPKLDRKAEEVVSNCVACILATRKQGKQEGFLNPIEKSDVPLHTLHLDHLGPLPSTSKNYKYLFVIVDGFTKFTWIYPVKPTSTEEVIQKMGQQSEVFGNPHRVVTDRGTAFTSNAFRSYCEERGIQHAVITTGVPRGNGQVERINQIIISILSKLSVADPQKWFKYAPRVQQIINSANPRSTTRSPFELMIGVPMYKTDDLELSGLLEEAIVDNFDAERREMRSQAKVRIQQIQEENRKSFNRRRKPARSYKLHDLVAIKRTQFGAGLKLYPKFLGPYEVTKVKGKDRYDVRKVGNHDGPNSTTSAADFMKPWVQPEGSDDDSEENVEGSPEAGDFQDGRVWESDHTVGDGPLFFKSNHVVGDGPLVLEPNHVVGERPLFLESSSGPKHETLSSR